MTATAQAAVSAPWQRFGPAYVDRLGRPVEHGMPEAGVAAASIGVERLAEFLSPLAVSRDWSPASPWTGVERLPVRRPERPAASGDPAVIGAEFAAAVDRVTGDHDTVAVSLSGGLDSLAVLVALAGRDRRLVAVTSDSVDELGRSPVAMVRDQLGALGHPVELRVVPYRLAGRPLPSWRAAGPGFHSTPREHRALADAAEDAGAGVLLYGGGADQLLALPRRPTRPGVRSRRRWTGTRPRTDLVRLSRPAVAAGWWAATVAPLYRRAAGPDLLAGDHAARVRDGFHAFARDQVAHHVSQGWGPWRARAFERLYPHDALPAATGLPLRSPFYDPAFASYCWSLPLAARHDPRLPTDYQRDKALVLRLLPERLAPALPSSVMRSRDHAADYWRAEKVEPTLLHEIGLLHPQWRTRARSLYDLQMVAECEWWLRQALDRGARLGEEGTTSR